MKLLLLGKEPSCKSPIRASKLGKILNWYSSRCVQLKILTNLTWKEGFGTDKDLSVPSEAVEYIIPQYRLGLGAAALKAEQMSQIKGRLAVVTRNYDHWNIKKKTSKE
jgi:hypothetical protein